MKKYFLLILGVCTIFLITSCQNSSTTEKYIQKIDFQKIVEERNAEDLNTAKWWYCKGDVQLRSGDSNDILAMSDFLDEQGLKTFFRLQVERVDKFFNKFQDIELLFTGNALLLVDQEKKNYTVLSIDSDYVYDNRIPLDSFKASNIEGYGLAMIKYKPVSALRSNDAGDPAPSEVSCKCVSEIPAGGCSSGGLSASSCSVSVGSKSCTVSCKEETAACCNEQATDDDNN
ncbi:MAG: hypothetical protein AAF990_18465 [Bacteroidota bacterium]